MTKLILMRVNDIRVCCKKNHCEQMPHHLQKIWPNNLIWSYWTPYSALHRVMYYVLHSSYVFFYFSLRFYYWSTHLFSSHNLSHSLKDIDLILKNDFTKLSVVFSIRLFGVFTFNFLNILYLSRICITNLKFKILL